MKPRGFTLLEILIALVIFAIVGVITAIALGHVIDTHKRLASYDDRLQKVEVAVALMRRDISQALDRSVLDYDNNRLAPFIDNNNKIEFTRGGLLNPFHLQQRSDLQRISYQINGGTIQRLTWSVLDRFNTTKPQRINLLKGVTDFTIIVYDNKNQPQNYWPAKQGTALTKQPTSILPKAVKIRFTVDKLGPVSLTIPITSRGVVIEQTPPPKKSS